ncbi:dipeptide epimerase [Erythrobacter sp. NE805]|uniref:dipeptide epimerase n=1 Tax=Erythrobacter sp. NE805 TaxID=3389875 RepID=UPI00396B482C
MTLRLALTERIWPLREPFVIARGSRDDQPVLEVRVTDAEGRCGRGEACGVPYAGETPQSMSAEIEAVRGRIEQGIDRHALLALLPPGGARFALDAALWDLEARQSGVSAFARAGLEPRPVTVSRTIGIRAPQAHEAAARQFAAYPLLKIKVNAEDPLAAIRASRCGAPASRLIVDPNQSWTPEMVRDLAPELAALGVVLLEQPVPVGAEAGLDGYDSPVPLCADELIDGIEDLPLARGRFAYVNIKLDKTGGLTAALALAEAARAQGFGLMVGCMNGSSLCMAPAMVLAQLCEFADLDGPLLQAEDVAHGFAYDNGRIAQPHQPLLWG